MGVDVDPIPWDPGAVVAMDKFTWTTEILWRKRGGMAALQVRESVRARESPREPSTCLDRLLWLFWAHYTEDGPYLLCTGSL